MTTIIKFVRYHEGVADSYACDWPGNATGEYVPLVEYQELRRNFKDIDEAYGSTMRDLLRLEALVKRVIEIGPRLDDFDIVEGQTPILIQLLKDCQDVIDPLPLPTPQNRSNEMTETMWKILDILRRSYLDPGQAGYWTIWHLQDRLGIELEGCGCPGDPALTNLVKFGLIEELSDLHCRYRIVVIIDDLPFTYPPEQEAN